MLYRRLCGDCVGLDAKTTKNLFTKIASPTKALEKIDMVTDNLRMIQKKQLHLKTKLEEKRQKDGIVMTMDQSCDLFNEEVDLEARKGSGIEWCDDCWERSPVKNTMESIGPGNKRC